jgi:CheY-like chemotaxis protein
MHKSIGFMQEGEAAGGVPWQLLASQRLPIRPRLARLWLGDPGMVMTGEPPPRKRILIVDDDPSIRYMLCRVLVDEAYAVLTAADGREGLKMAAAEEIDLVLLDLKMPAMNGAETLRQLALLRPGLPVIIITAYPRRPSEDGLAGVSALLQKPLDFPMLLQTIGRLLAQAAA